MRKYQTEFEHDIVRSFLADEGEAKSLAWEWFIPAEKIRTRVKHFRSQAQCCQASGLCETLSE